MANVIYQVTPGRIIINSIDLPLDDCVMSYRFDSVLNQYKISIRSSCGNHSWLSDQPLNSIEDNANTTYATIAAWKTWWNALDQGASTIVIGSGTPIDFATAAKQDEQITSLKQIAGQSFLVISDTNAHAGLDCTSIYVMNDAVFSEILVSASNVVSARGLSGITIVANTLLPFGKAHATSITLTSGTVIAYIN